MTPRILFLSALVGSAMAGGVPAQATDDDPYASKLDQAFRVFESEDYPRALESFRDIRKAFPIQSAPATMIELVEIFSENPDLRTVRWELVATRLSQLKASRPATPAYEAFVARQAHLAEADRECAVFLDGLQGRAALRRLREAAVKWPDSRVLRQIATPLVEESLTEGDSHVQEGIQRILEEKWQESGDALTQAHRSYRRAEGLLTTGIGAELESKIRSTEKNIGAFEQFMTGVQAEARGQHDEATRALQLVVFGTVYWSTAQARIQANRIARRLEDVTSRYRAGEIAKALLKLRELKMHGRDDQNLQREIIRLESKYVRIERSWSQLQQAVEAKDHCAAIWNADSILALERDDPAGNWYVDQATGLRSEARTALGPE